MRRSIVLALILLLVAFAAVQTGRPILFNLVYLIGATLLLSFVWAFFNVHWLSLRRITEAKRIQVGRTFEERFVVYNRSIFPKLWLEVRDFSELPEHHASRVVSSLGPRRSRGWAVRTHCYQRGRFRLGPMRILSGDPLGLYQFTRNISQTSSIIVYPAAYQLPSFAPPIGQLVGGEAIQRRTHNVTPSASGVRDYEPGDSFNRIHWRSTARTGRLIVKEFEEDPTAHIWLILDLQQEMQVEAPEYEPPRGDRPVTIWSEELPEEIPPTTEEYAVTIAASLARHFIERNRSVGFIAHGEDREIIQPDRGSRQMTKILEHLAVLRAHGQRRLEEVITLENGFFTRGTTVVAITASPAMTWVDALRELQRRGVQTMAVTIDGASFNRERLSVEDPIEELNVAGIPAYLIRQGDRLADVLAQQARAI